MHTVSGLADTARGIIIEAFAGPGGWSEGLRMLGLHEHAHGYEWNPEACATARAAGHKRIQADVSMVDLQVYVDMIVWLLIMSPPCQSFSSAGKQLGKLDKPRIFAHVQRIRDAGRWLHYSREGWHDDRSPLVLEPLRWALSLLPEHIALEQVPAVLPLWEAMADVLRDHGYHVAVGLMQAEQYGVPQTRKRAIFVARRCNLHASDRFYDWSGYHIPERMAGLDCDRQVGLPAPTHRPYRKGVARTDGDPLLLPWVSMADALGWAPGGMVGFPRRADTASNKSDGTVTLDGVDYRARDFRGTDEPALGLTEKVRSWQLRANARSNAAVRDLSEPAPTLTAGKDGGERVWEPGAAAADARYGDPAGTKAVRVSVPEAAVLQTFPADYPWQGSRTAQYRQVGDAVPPLLAAAVVRSVTGL